MPSSHQGRELDIHKQTCTVSGLVGTMVTRRVHVPLKEGDMALQEARSSNFSIFNVMLYGLFNVGNQFQLF